MRLLCILLVLMACAACGDGPIAPSREKVQPVPVVVR